MSSTKLYDIAPRIPIEWQPQKRSHFGNDHGSLNLRLRAGTSCRVCSWLSSMWASRGRVGLAVPVKGTRLPRRGGVVPCSAVATAEVDAGVPGFRETGLVNQL